MVRLGWRTGTVVAHLWTIERRSFLSRGLVKYSFIPASKHFSCQVRFGWEIEGYSVSDHGVGGESDDGNGFYDSVFHLMFSYQRSCLKSRHHRHLYILKSVTV